MEKEFNGSKNCMSKIDVKLDENSIRRSRCLLFWPFKSNQIKGKYYSVNPIVEQRSVFGISFFITFLS